jgi:N-methylhydantoinase B
VSAGTHHPGADVGEVIAVAMQHVLPERAVPQTYKTGIPTIIVGTDPRTGATFTDHSAEVYAGWCNASKGMDAWGALNASFGNLWKATAEINESLYPHVQWSRDYRTDSGGPGEWRGICGQHYEKEVRVDAKVYTYVVGMKYPMPGICGGENGAPNEMIIRTAATTLPRRSTPPTGSRSRPASASCTTTAAAAVGAIRSIAIRKPVLDDVLDEYVSVEGARRDYGVVLTGSLEDLTLAIDDDATHSFGNGCGPGTNGLPSGRGRRRDVHRSDLRHADGRGRARQDPDDTRRPVNGRDERAR